MAIHHDLKGFTEVDSFEEWVDRLSKGANGKQSGNLKLTYYFKDGEFLDSHNSVVTPGRRNNISEFLDRKYYIKKDSTLSKTLEDIYKEL